jgi:hypothetical protein
MDITRLHEILNKCTIQLRKGDVVEQTDNATHIYGMPHVSEVKDDPEIETVDMELLAIGVRKTVAENHKAGLLDLLKTYPQPDRLAAGPSYIEVGAEIGDQGAAFQLFALGKVLGFWDVITPATLGITGPEAHELAGRGMVMCSGFKL